MGNLDHLIYKIVDPANNKPFYVGQTANIKERINQHMCTKKGALGERIQQIRKSGLKPIFVVIAQSEYKDAIKTEKYWISKLRDEGFELCNVIRKNAIRYDLIFDIELKI